jgi:predicted nuclease of predicted toxin-antitoxin system
VKLLIDNALPHALARSLGRAGYDVKHVRDYGLGAAEDHIILERAAREGRVIVSADADFAMLLAVRRVRQPSFILFREPHLTRAEDYLSRLVECLPLLAGELETGCVATFRRGKIRIRSFPF